MSSPPSRTAASCACAGRGRSGRDRTSPLGSSRRRIGSRPAKPHHQPHRRDEAVEHHAEQDPRVDPAQRLAQLHPEPVDGCQDPRRDESRHEQEDRRAPGPTSAGSVPRTTSGPEPDQRRRCRRPGVRSVRSCCDVVRPCHAMIPVPQSSSNSSRQSLSPTSGFWSRLLEDAVLEHQHVHLGAHEAAVGVVRACTTIGSPRTLKDVLTITRAAGLGLERLDAARSSAGSSSRGRSGCAPSSRRG